MLCAPEGKRVFCFFLPGTKLCNELWKISQFSLKRWTKKSRGVPDRSLHKVLTDAYMRWELQILGWKNTYWQNDSNPFVHSHRSITEASPQSTYTTSKSWWKCNSDQRTFRASHNNLNIKLLIKNITPFATLRSVTCICLVSTPSFPSYLCHTQQWHFLKELPVLWSAFSCPFLLTIYTNTCITH